MRLPGFRWLAVGLVALSTGAMAQHPARPLAGKPGGVHPSGSMGKLKPVDINHATQEELAFMLKLDAATAAKIVAGRPYLTKARLLTQKVVSPEVYEAIRSRIVARQSNPPISGSRTDKPKK